jgi:demethylmenaquinone methyltransferase / 2-methoxy-6-polyprenyl-1,4-benzoquinol methylase
MCSTRKQVGNTSPAQDMRAMFDRLASDYDRLNHVFSLGQDIAWRKAAVRTLDLPGGALVVDLCGGTGALHRALLRHSVGSGHRVLNIDLSERMLQQACVPTAAENDVAHICAQALRTPLRTACADAVLLGFGLRNIADRQAALEEVVRILKPGGTLVLWEFTSGQEGLRAGIFRFYFHQVMPVLAAMLGSDRHIWQYLPRSVDSFLTKAQLIGLLEKVHMEVRQHRRLSLGICSLIVASKRQE